jgi:hypothetical protein
MERVEEEGSAKNLNDWAAKWFTSGEDVDASWVEWVPFVSDSPDKFGDAVVSGRGDKFKLDIPDNPISQSTKGVMKALEIEADERDFYWNAMKPASDWLDSHDEVINEDSLAAVIWLQQNRKPLNSENVNHVLSSWIAKESDAREAEEQRKIRNANFNQLQDVPE